MEVSVVIPTCDRNDLLTATLRSLLIALEGVEAEVIVVNDSKTQTPVLSFEHKLIHLLNNPNKGAASARNYGAQHARGRFLLFLDDDILLLPASISILLRLAHAHPRSCFNLNWILTPQLLEKIQPTYFGKYLLSYKFTSLGGWYGATTPWPEGQLIEVNSIASYALLIERSVFREVGGYETTIPYAGFEDYILSKRLKSLGVRMYVYSEVLAYHNEEDRLILTSWLERKKRGGATRAAAVIAGYEELRLIHFPPKRLIYLMLYYSNAKMVFLKLAYLMEKLRLPLCLYFRVVNMLLGLYHFEGYYECLKGYKST